MSALFIRYVEKKGVTVRAITDYLIVTGVKLSASYGVFTLLMTNPLNVLSSFTSCPVTGWLFLPQPEPPTMSVICFPSRSFYCSGNL